MDRWSEFWNSSLGTATSERQQKSVFHLVEIWKQQFKVDLSESNLDESRANSRADEPFVKTVSNSVEQ